jgi:MFS family permease
LRSLHLPVWLGSLGWGKGVVFAGLTTAETAGRALLTTVIPLEAYALLADAQQVSLLFFGFSVAGLATSLAIPWLLGFMARRWLFTLATIAGIAGCVVLFERSVTALVLGMVLRAFAASCLDVLFNLYVLDNIARREMGRFEPLRVLFQAVPWTVGPWLGVRLQEDLGAWSPYAVGAGLGLAGLAYFWALRLSKGTVLRRATRQPTNPLHYLPRFAAQPRLRLAWVLAFGRAGWWTMFFIYAPIYAVAAGLSEETGGLLVSLGAAALFLVPLWGWVGRRYGVRRLLVAGYGVTALLTLAVFAVADMAWAGVAVLVGAAFTAGSIDGAGNVPFLRAVRPLEREPMTTVFTTYRDAAAVAPPGAFTLLLKAFELPVVFIVGGAGMLALAGLARHIPRRL